MKSIAVENLLVRRPAGFVLGPLDFTLPAGSRTALVGPSGCGKTTLLRCLAGLHDPDGGVVAIGGRQVNDRRRPVPPGERRIGFVFQDGGLWPHMTALEHLRFANKHLGKAAALDLLARVELGGKAQSRPGKLSGGEAQRLALARALAGDPEILLLDEPLGSVDVALRTRLAVLIRRLAEERGLTLVVVTHDRDEALAMADDLVVLHAGRIVESGAAAELLRAPRNAFTATFLGDATCWPLASNGSDQLDTPFGRIAAPADRSRPHALVLLPGDVRLVASGGVAARVLRVYRDAFGCRAVVEFAGHTLPVACDDALVEHAAVELQLTAAPRVLPMEPEEPA